MPVWRNRELKNKRVGELHAKRRKESGGNMGEEIRKEGEGKRESERERGESERERERKREREKS